MTVVCRILQTARVDSILKTQRKVCTMAKARKIRPDTVLKNYWNDNEHHVDKTVIMTVAGATNCKIDYLALDGKGVAGMYSLFDEIAKDSKEEGDFI